MGTTKEPQSPRKRRARRHNGDGCLYYDAKRNRWRGKFKMDRPEDGGRFKYVSGATREEATRLLREAMVSYENGTTAPVARSGSMTVADWMDQWLRDVVGPDPDVADTTAEEYERSVRLHVKPHVGTVRLSDLNGEHIRAMLGQMAAKRPKPSAQTMRHAFYRLRAAIESARDCGLVPVNVVTTVKPPVLQRDDPETYTRDELLTIFTELDRHERTRDGGCSCGASGCRGWVYRPLFVLARETGLRTGELLGLHWSDLNLGDEADLRVRRSLRRNGEVAKPKSRAGTRTVPIGDPSVAATLAQLGRNLRQENGRAATSGGAYVFAKADGSPVEHRNLHRVWRRAEIRAGLAPERRHGVHGLRRWYATELARRGVPVAVAQQLLGHSKPETTIIFYTAVDEEMKRDVARRLLGAGTLGVAA